MNQKTLNEKVALLKDGIIVEIDGLMFSAKRINDEDAPVPCEYCNVDCACRGNVPKVCAELDDFSKSLWYLWLES